jgi:RNA polymerase-interacting CarD/CdnL/TRCF family regulator
MYSLLQKLEQRLRKAEVLINLAERKSSKYLSIEDRERLNAVNNFIEDYYLFVNYINKQYEIKNLTVIQEALKSKQEQLTFYLNTLDEIINRRIEYSKN